MKRSNSHISITEGNVKRTKSIDRRPANEGYSAGNEFEAPSERLSVKSEISVPVKISTSLTANHVPNDAEKVAIPIVWPPSVMIKKSAHFEADLKLIDEKVGKIRRQREGIFIKLLPDTFFMHRELIYFLEANNIQYLTPRRIRAVIIGLPCDMRPQQIKMALIEKDFDVDHVFQRMDCRTKKPLPIFHAFLPNSGRNKDIFNLTDLLNFNISVGRIGRSRRRKRSTKYGVKHTHKKGAAKSKVSVPKCVNHVQTGQVGSSSGDKKLHEVSQNNLSNPGTTDVNLAPVESSHHQEQLRRMKNMDESGPAIDYQRQLRMNNTDESGPSNGYQEPRRMNNMDESGSASDFQGIIYIMQEFRKLFGKFKDDNTFAQQLRNAANSVEKFHLFSKLFLD